MAPPEQSTRNSRRAEQRCGGGDASHAILPAEQRANDEALGEAVRDDHRRQRTARPEHDGGRKRGPIDQRVEEQHADDDALAQRAALDDGLREPEASVAGRQERGGGGT
jgi:hypothetical protein